MRRSGQSTVFWLLIWTVLFAIGTGVFLVWRPQWNTESAARGFGLRATEREGHIRLDWNPNAAAILRADTARLEAVDGGRPAAYPVENRILRSGGLDYIPQTKDVLLTLTLLRNGIIHEQAAVRSVGPIEQQPAIVEPPPRRVTTRQSGRRAPVRGRARRR
jgi:hypothetical protein